MAAATQDNQPGTDQADDLMLVMLPDDELLGFPEGFEQPATPLEVDPEDPLRSTAESIDQELADQISREDRERKRLVSLLRLTKALGIVIAVVIPGAVALGWPYYSLPSVERPFHPMHEALRPSGTVGLTAGLVGCALILTSLIYVVRKYVGGTSNAAALPGWLRFHMAASTLGSVAVVIHTGFLPTSALGVLSLGAMLVVVMSGIMGRYLLTVIPRAVETSDSGFDVVQKRLEVYKGRLVSLGMAPEMLGTDEANDRSRRVGSIAALVRILWGDRASKREFRRLKQAVNAVHGLGEEARVVLILVQRLCQERQVFVRYHELRRVLGTWRFLHRWFTVLLLLGAFFHILVAVQYGELWIFGGPS